MYRREALKSITFGASGALLFGKPTKRLNQLEVTEVIVSAGRTFNHPFESYSNFRPNVTIKAAVVKGEKIEDKIFALQQNAERIVENHKQRILDECKAQFTSSDDYFGDSEDMQS